MRKTEFIRFIFVKMRLYKSFTLILFLWLPTLSFGQTTNVCTKQIRAKLDSVTTIVLDTLIIYPYSFAIKGNNGILDTSLYKFNYATNTLTLVPGDTNQINVTYRVFPSSLNRVYQDKRLIAVTLAPKNKENPFMISGSDAQEDPFSTGGIQKSGSISRGVNFGNNQDLSINSNLNLQLTGNITQNLKISASLSDDNLPLQAQGNTNQLQEFDKVFVQIYTDKLKITGGDYWLYKPKGYFVKYNKRAQGISIEYQDSLAKNIRYTSQGSLALSKGKFNRAIIQGVEGNQGPYRLRGAENEPFIIVLSGTEKIYIDGRELKRGQEFDYIIDYNTSEITFTTRNQITKDIRIVAEYQYSDQNYARILQQASATIDTKNSSFWFNAYNELDAKNQPIQQSLSLSQKKTIAALGDSIQFAQISSFDSIGYQENQIVYKLQTIAGVDSVLVYSVNKDSALYRANFTYVGANKGHYRFKQFIALGKVYEYVIPIGGVPQGDYQPSLSIITPKQRKMFSIGNEVRFKKLKIRSELALSEYDINTFSAIDKKNDQNGAASVWIERESKFKKDSSYRFITRYNLEIVGKTFNPIETFRSVEFDRDWNTRNQRYYGNQISNSAVIGIKHLQKGSITLTGDNYQIGTDFSGYRLLNEGRWASKGFRANWNGSYLTVKGTETSEFLRHKLDVSQKIGKIRIGFIDDQEQNIRNTATQPITLSSYQFYDWQAFVASDDTAKFSYRLYYRERYDKKPDTNRLQNAAKAQTAGALLKINLNVNNRLTVQGNLRSLAIVNQSLISQTPENTLGTRLDYDGNLLKGAMRVNSFYEIGSGLELKREFIYIKVNDGQGTYFWNDYNADGIKDLNEFEIAQYTDQASYIRVFTPSSTYVKVFTNELNQSIFWQPEKIWAKKTGLLNILKYASNQVRIRLLTKASDRLDGNFYNPFYTKISDTVLVSKAQSFKNTLFLNRTGATFGMDFSIEENNTKTLLASGFDQRNLSQKSTSARWNFKRYFSLNTQYDFGKKRSFADYTQGRNYNYAFQTSKSSFAYTPSSSMRFTLNYRYTQKENDLFFGGEKAFINDVGISSKWNQASKGSLQANVNLVVITFDSQTNNALSFEFLEALKVGQNYVWNLSYQRNLSKTLQLTIQYNGRKSEGVRAIHAGGMELRAFF